MAVREQHAYHPAQPADFSDRKAVLDDLPKSQPGAVGCSEQQNHSRAHRRARQWGKRN